MRGRNDDHPGSSHNKNKAPSGLIHTWRLWRHCCCRYGWYPLIVAPIVTAGCFLSVYSSGGCDFVRVNIGFTPTNDAWNQTTVELGFFYYQSGIPHDDKLYDAFAEGCKPYESGFTDNFIRDDRTWKVARIMGLISAFSSITAAVTAWLFVVSPLPAFFFWPGVLLPALMAAFLAEGSKFLFFDTSICRNTVWFPSGADSLPRVAEECTLGPTGHYAIAAGTVFFLSLILVCLKAPEKRILRSHYGTDNEQSEQDLEMDHHDYAASEGSYGEGSVEMYDDDHAHGGSYEESQVACLGSSHTDVQELQYSPRSKRSKEEPAYGYDSEKGGSSKGGSFFGSKAVDDASTECLDARKPKIDEAKSLAVSRMRTLDSSEDKYRAKPKDETEVESPDDRYQPTKPAPTIVVPDQTISESRKKTIEKMELNTNSGSEDLIEKFVSDLNLSFQVKPGDETEAKEQNCTPGILQNLCGPSHASQSSF